MNAAEQAQRRQRLNEIEAAITRQQGALDTIADDISTLLNAHATKQQAWVVQQLSDHRTLLDQQVTDQLNAIARAANRRITLIEGATINLNFLGRLRFVLTGRF